MDMALLTEIIQTVFAIGRAVLKYGPVVLQSAENIYSDLEMAYQSVSAGAPLSADQLAAIRANLDRANAAVGAAAQAAEAQDQALAVAEVKEETHEEVSDKE